MQRSDIMQLRSVRLPEDFEYFEDLYYEAFPEYERIPLEELYEFRAEDKVDISLLDDNGKPVGLIIMYYSDGIPLLSYYAVDHRMRGGGYGTRGIEAIAQVYPGVIIEIESTYEEDAEDIETRRRRKIFYERNGFVDTPFLVNYFGIEMELMTTAEDFTLDDYFDSYYRLYAEDYVADNIQLIRTLDNI